MVVGEKFIWGHIPKTGGDAVWKYFTFFPDLYFFAHHPSRNWKRKHKPFCDTEFNRDNKLIALNIRRLPDWVMSFEWNLVLGSKQGYFLWPHVRPRPAAILSKLKKPDELLASWLDDGDIAVDHWIRSEFLLQDFVRFVRHLTDVGEDMVGRLAETDTKPAHQYDHDMNNWFTKEQMIQLYETNKEWAKLEARLYPDDEKYPNPFNSKVTKFQW